MTWVVRVVLATLVVLALATGTASATNNTPETAIVVSAANPSVTGNIVGATGGTYRYYRFATPGAVTPINIHLTWNPGWSSTNRAFSFNVYGPNNYYVQAIRGDDVGTASTALLDVGPVAPGDYFVQVYSYTAGTSNDYTLDFKGLGGVSGPTPAPAATTPDKPVPVQQQGPQMSGTLVGNSGGAFNFYTINYPGGHTDMTVSLTFGPANLLSADAFGFKVYQKDAVVAPGQDALVATGGEVSRTFDTAVKSATIRSVIPGPYLLQVYNYAQGVSGSYVVGVNGLAGAPIEATGNGTPDKAIPLSPSTTAAHGTIAGNSGGAFAYYSLNYQGANNPLNITIAYTPGMGTTGKSVGLFLYRGSDLVATGGPSEGVTPLVGVAWLTYASDQPGPYMLQVHNYAPGITIDYTVYAAGLIQ